MNGWIKLHRKLLEKAFYCKDSEKVHLWIHLLLKANHYDYEEMLGAKPIICKPGQFTTGRKQLSLETGISESKIERILTYFEKIEQQIEQRKTSTNRLVSIRNWSDYQESEQQIEQQVNNDRTTSEQRPNTLQEYKEEKKYKKILLSEIKISDLNENQIEYFEIAKSFFELFKKNLTDAGASLVNLEKAKASWIDDIRLIIEKDHYYVDDLRAVFKLLQTDDFWKQNILSTATLRKQMDKLMLKIKANGTKKNGRSNEACTWEQLAGVISKEFGGN